MVINRLYRIPALLGTGFYKQPEKQQAQPKKVSQTKVAALLKKDPSKTKTSK
jgi:hypothetical protein